jgi:hypothetical protein
MLHARRFALGAGAAGFLAALWLTHPLAGALGHALLDDGSYDPYQFCWNLWWVRESLLGLHTNPFFTRHLFHPDGVPLLFHTFAFSFGVASLPLQLLFGVLPAHNVLVLAAPALTFVATAWLAREVTGDGTAALAAGLVGAVNPIAAWFAPVLYLSAAYLVALTVLAWWRLQRRRRAGDALLVVALLVVLVFASQEYAMMTLALLALDTVLRLAAAERLGLPRAWGAGTAAVWGSLAAALGVLAAVALAAPPREPPSAQAVAGSVHVAGLVVPPWLQAPPVEFARIYHLGTAPLLFLPVALVLGGRRARFFGLALLALLAMSLGPYLHWQSPLTDPEVLRAGRMPTGPPGPYLLALKVVPLLQFFRAPFRWLVVAQLVLGVLVALGLAGLRARVQRRALATAAVLAVLVAGAVLEVRALRAPLASAAIPAAYRVLREDPAPGAVLTLPSGFPQGPPAAFSSLYMYWQTAHGRPLLEGTVARLPPGRRVLLARRLEDFAALPWVRYVVIHRDLVAVAYPAARRQVADAEALLARQGRLVAREGGVDVYALSTFRPETIAPSALR